MLVVSQDDPADFALAAPLQRRLPGAQCERECQVLVAAVLARGFHPQHVSAGRLDAPEVVATVPCDRVVPGRTGRTGDAERGGRIVAAVVPRSEEHTSELQSLMRITYAAFFLKNK